MSRALRCRSSRSTRTAMAPSPSSIALDDLPEGNYRLDLKAAEDLIASTDFAIDRILKPAYKLDVTTGRRVYVQGDRIRVTAHATFYEGTPVPGVALRSDGFVERTFVTDATGTATLLTTREVRGLRG